jgi:hypothetical protein
MGNADFQTRARESGKKFEGQAADFLESQGFRLLGSRIIPEVGCEVDEVAVAPNGEQVYFEFKGSYNRSKGKPGPGMERTDTAKKGLLTGFLLQSVGDPIPYYILTSHLPVKGRALAMTQRSVESGAEAGVLLIDSEETRMFLKERFGSGTPGGGRS